MTLEGKGRPVNILLIEDNPGDIRLTEEALVESKVCNRLYIAQDGVQAIAMLHQEGKYASTPRPDLILLDLNLPKKDGLGVLEEIKADEDLKRIPVVVLTTSSAEEDIIKTYGLYANCYVTKPVDLNQFIAVVQNINDFWFSIVRLPHCS